MIALGLGLGLVLALFWAASAFSRASVMDIKELLTWVVALAGLALAAMLFLTGRGAAAIGGLVLLGPLAWSYWQESRGGGGRGPAGGGQGRAGGTGRRMSRVEALAVLGLTEGASDSDIRAAWVRLMRAVHPDGGGSDDLASRVNQARDVLLGGRRG